MNFLRFVGNDGCSETAYAQRATDESVRVIDTSPKDGNVTVHFFQNEKPLFVQLPTAARDLLDIATMVYIADEIQQREDAQDRWTRDFDFFVPVKKPAVWRKNEPLLIRTLSHLSGDRYRFTWAARAELKVYGRHRARLPQGFDIVCLYSGGVDSLLGALHYLQAGKKVLLCGHYADGITAKAQTDIFEALQKQFGKAVTLCQCRVARTLRPKVAHEIADKVEDSHRPRSFLFLGIAAAIAAAAKVSEIAIPENGLIGLNAPLAVSRSGTFSTRTAHPRFLADFLSFIRAIGAFNGSLKNPFLYQSKTDLLRGLPATTHPLLLRSVSCAHVGRVRWTGKKGIRHCGYCVPCLYRRIAFMDLGIDRAADYYCDVLADLPNLSETEQGDFRFLTRFAARVIEMNSAERQALILSQGNFAPQVCAEIGPHAANDYSELADMLKGWADDYITKVKRHASTMTKRVLGLQ